MNDIDYPTLIKVLTQVATTLGEMSASLDHLAHYLYVDDTDDDQVALNLVTSLIDKLDELKKVCEQSIKTVRIRQDENR